MMTKHLMVGTLMFTAVVATAPCASATGTKRTVIVFGPTSDPVALRARAELERANVGVLTPIAQAEVSRAEIETMSSASGASAALVVRPEGVDVWLIDDATHRALLVERVEDDELGALRAVEITRANFAAPAVVRQAASPPAAAPSASPALSNDRRALDVADEVPRWTIGASTGPAFLGSQNRAYANSFIVPIEVGLERRLGPTVGVGVYGGGAPGVSSSSGERRSVVQWRVGASVQLRLGSKPGAGMWTSLAAGYTVLEFAPARRGADAALSAGYDFHVSNHTTIGPFLSARVGISEGQVFQEPVPSLSVFMPATFSREGGATWFSSGVVGARVTFAGL